MDVANIIANIAFYGLEHGVKRCTDKANPALCAAAALQLILARPGERIRIRPECVSCLRRVLPEHIGVGVIIVKSDPETKQDYIVFVPNPPIKK